MSGGDVFLSATVLEFSLLSKYALTLQCEPDTAWDSKTKGSKMVIILELMKFDVWWENVVTNPQMKANS